MHEAAGVPSTRILRGLSGLAGALSGSAAIILSTSAGQATRGFALRPPQASACGAAGGAADGCAAITLLSPSVIWAAVSDPAFAASQVVNHESSAPVNSSRVTAPSLLASVALKIAAPRRRRAAAAAPLRGAGRSGLLCRQWSDRPCEHQRGARGRRAGRG